MVNFSEISSMDIYSASTEQLELWLDQLYDFEEEMEALGGGLSVELQEMREAIEDEFRIRGS